MTVSKVHYLFRSLLLLLLVVALVAPFTFMKMPQKEISPTVEPAVPVKKVIKIAEQPLHNVPLPDFANIRDVKEKKKQFFAFISPAVLDENQRLRDLRAEVSRMLEQLSLELPLLAQDHTLLASLVKKYKVSKKFSPLRQLYALEQKIDIVPAALVLVQAANESAWGTSRFARIGLNFFGIWCYQKGCGMVPNGRNEGAKHEVAAYPSVEHAVARYFHNINTNGAYIVFRTIRAQLREQNQALAPEILATGLLPYSERGTDYVLELTEMIRHNRDYLVMNEAD
jgi:Bax protein